MESLEIIKDDMFEIAKRLKSINKNYVLVRNKKLNRFELHFLRPILSLEAVFPYKSIDKRMVDYVNKYKKENIDKIIKQIDENNEKITEKNNKTFKQDYIDKIKEDLKYDSK